MALLIKRVNDGLGIPPFTHDDGLSETHGATLQNDVVFVMTVYEDA